MLVPQTAWAGRLILAHIYHVLTHILDFNLSLHTPSRTLSPTLTLFRLPNFLFSFYHNY